LFTHQYDHLIFDFVWLVRAHWSIDYYALVEYLLPFEHGEEHHEVYSFFPLNPLVEVDSRQRHAFDKHYCVFSLSNGMFCTRLISASPVLAVDSLVPIGMGNSSASAIGTTGVVDGLVVAAVPAAAAAAFVRYLMAINFS
jgi:hypothetical protein